MCIEKSCNKNKEDPTWQLIDTDLEEQSAVTIWRPLSRTSLENALNSTTTMVELKPKTGRFHQLRRHMVSANNAIVYNVKVWLIFFSFV